MFASFLRGRLAARSGTAPAGTARATGIPASLLDAAAAGAMGTGAAAAGAHAGAMPEEGVALDDAEAAGAAAGRRARPPLPGEAVLVDGVAQKILGYWLQNRHQVLFPLTVNFRTLGPEAARAVAAMMAVSALARGAVADADRRSSLDWLRRAGAEVAVTDAFEAALARPPALSDTIAAVLAEPSLAAYAYVVAVVSLGHGDEMALSFLEYLSARLALPRTVVRSANRRYRR